MTVKREIYKVERVAPIRFTRFKGALPPDRYAPDPDDRGFMTQHGPILGLCRGDIGRVTLVRAQLDAKAPLWVTSSDKAKLTIPGDPRRLEDGEEVEIPLLALDKDGDPLVQVRAERADGPIVGLLTVHISQIVDVLCAVHRTAIYTAPSVRAAANTTTRSFAAIDSLMAEVNRQWRPAGVRFRVDTRKDDTNLTNQVARNGINPTDGTLLCPVFGSGEANENFTRLMNTNKVASRLNLHFVPVIGTASADGTPNYIGFGSSFHKGLVVSDNARSLEYQGHVLAHELGHILTIAAMGHTNANDSHSDDDPQWNATVAKRRHDLWSRRRLMYFMVGLQALERTGPGGRYAFDGTDAGHGAGNPGHMITIKNLANDATDNEYTDARKAASKLFP